MHTKLILALPLLALACAPLPPQPTASLPRDAVVGAGEPTRAAVARVSSAFTPDGRLRGTAAENARTIANLEFLAVNTSNNPLLDNAPSVLPVQLQGARQEWRQAFGIPADAPPQSVINSLYASASAADAGAAPATLAAFQAPGPLPRTAAAAALAGEALRIRPNDRAPR